MSTLVEIERAVDALPAAQQEDLLRWLQSRLVRQFAASPGSATEWVRSAKGSVRLAAHESADDARMDYYQAKYGVNK